GHWPWLLAGFALCLPPLLACMARWKMILDAQDMTLGWKRVNTIFLIGLFFNSFMIGPTGGDLIKAYYTARETHHKKTEAITTIFIDRVIGLLILALVVGGMILVRWTFYMENPITRAFAWPALIASGIILGGGLVAFSIHVFEVFPWLRRLNSIPLVGKLMDTVERAYNAFYICRANPRLLVLLSLHSLFIQTIFVGVSWCVGQALSIDLPFLAYLSFAPLVGLISAIPITPGGIGIREGASIKLWSVLGVPDEKGFLLAFIPYIFLVLWGLPGGVMFLFHRPAAGINVNPEAET
ncbi:MAG: lysylphosphatidylglycerol synthase transmembrane domain-containing protein, partial [bacterium]